MAPVRRGEAYEEALRLLMAEHQLSILSTSVQAIRAGWSALGERLSSFWLM